MLCCKSDKHVPVGLRVVLVLLAVVSFTSCKVDAPSQEVQNLRAFSKMYGYVRFFHPSDEASTIDWNRFAVYGVTQVKDAASSQELQTSLERLFGPLTPTVQVFPTSDPPVPAKAPDDTADLQVIAWQHFGFGSSGRGSIYQSKRTGRVSQTTPGAGFGTVTQSVTADAYRGRRIKLSSSVRAEVADVGDQGQMWLRVDRSSGQRGFFNNMNDRPINSHEWQRYEIEGEVAEDATQIVFGCFLFGQGRLWVDDFELMVADDDDGWQAIEITNPGFEDGERGETPPGWSAASRGYRYELTDEGPRSGQLSVLIEDVPVILTEDLFEDQPTVREVIEKEIGAGLSARIPMALYGNESTTFPSGDEGALNELRAGVESLATNSLSADDVSVRLADVVIAWNVLQHFYPYFDVVDADWDTQLTRSLEQALTDETGHDFFYTLREMVASLQDGHGSVYHPDYQQHGRLPLQLEWVEGQVVVTASGDPLIERGDIIEWIDGVSAEEAVLEAERYISGSPQWKRWQAMKSFGAGDADSWVELVIRRGEKTSDVRIRRRMAASVPDDPRPGTIEELDEGVYYVNLSEAEMSEIDETMDTIAAARGVIFDLRGYPNNNHGVITHLLDGPDTSQTWMRVPKIIYPDHVEPSGYHEVGWGIKPLEPHIDANVVFITDGRAISYAESVMGFVEGYRLAEIVGQPTAGTNGNVNPMALPGGFRINWTGMKVVKHDGSQHHLVGIQPTVPVERTVQGVREGRDEFLEKALEIVKRGQG